MLGQPGSAGVSAGAVADTEVVPYNVVPELDERVACVIVEPVAANMNLVAPGAGFLEGLRAACSASGALLIFDEVITGFRLGAAGADGVRTLSPGDKPARPAAQALPEGGLSLTVTFPPAASPPDSAEKTTRTRRFAAGPSPTTTPTVPAATSPPTREAVLRR